VVVVVVLVAEVEAWGEMKQWLSATITITIIIIITIITTSTCPVEDAVTVFPVVVGQNDTTIVWRETNWPGTKMQLIRFIFNEYSCTL